MNARILSWLIVGMFVSMAAFVGLAIGMDAATGAKLGAFLVLVIGVFIAWLMPDRLGGLRLMAALFVCFGFVETVWPRLVVFKRAGIPALSPEKLAFAGLLLTWVMLMLTSRTVRESAVRGLSRYRPVLWSLGFLAVWRLITAFAGADGAYYYLGIKMALTEVCAYTLMLVIAVGVWQSPQGARRFIWAVVLGAMVVCLLGLYEAKVSRNLFGSFVAVEDDLTGRLSEALKDKFRGGSYRVQSTFEHPLVLAEFLVMAVPCALYLLFTTRRLLVRGVLLLSFVLFAAVAYKTDSRAALGLIALNLALGGMLTAYRQFRVKQSILGMVIGLLVPAVMLLLPVLVVLMMGLLGGGQTETQSTSARLLMLERALPLIMDSPLFGYGVGQGGAKVGYLMFSGLFSIDSHFLSLPLDSGLPALLAYLFAMAWFGWQLFSRVGDRSNPEGALAICMLLVLVGFCGMRAILSINTNHWLLFALMGVIGTMPRKALAPAAVHRRGWGGSQALRRA